MATVPAVQPTAAAKAWSSTPRRVILVSIAAAIVTMALKFGAYPLTGSVSLLSDAAESSVNLIAASWPLSHSPSRRGPPTTDYRYGYDKAEYFSSGVEGALILVAAITIIYTAIRRFLNPAPLTDLGIGLAISLVASGINFGVARFMFRKAEEFDSITLEADAHHLMTDVWTSVGVVAALVVVMFAPPKWAILDPAHRPDPGAEHHPHRRVAPQAVCGRADGHEACRRKRWTRSRKCSGRTKARTSSITSCGRASPPRDAMWSSTC